jgi:hypothetical protein
MLQPHNPNGPGHKVIVSTFGVAPVILAGVVALMISDTCLADRRNA